MSEEGCQRRRSVRSMDIVGQRKGEAAAAGETGGFDLEEWRER